MAMKGGAARRRPRRLRERAQQVGEGRRAHADGPRGAQSTERGLQERDWEQARVVARHLEHRAERVETAKAA